MWVKRTLGLLLAVAISAGLWWLRPIPADPAAMAVLEGASAPTDSAEPAPPEDPAPPPEDPAAQPVDPAPPPEDPAAPPEPPAVALTIRESRTYLDLSPAASQPTRGFAFFQGALVDPRAYAKILAPIAEAGYLVSIIKSPFDLPIVDIGGVEAVTGRHPEVTWWAVGGHSLGGVAASTYAAGNPRRTPALVLWASYPLSSLETVGLKVLSVSGTADGLTTPSDVEASVAKLPPTTTFVAVEGAVHSHFGDYGDQRGDGTPTISREEAQGQIINTTLQWLNTASAVA